MNEKELVLEAMKKAGEPVNAGKVVELTGLDIPDTAGPLAGRGPGALSIQRIPPICIMIITGPVLLVAIAPTTPRT